MIYVLKYGSKVLVGHGNDSFIATVIGVAIYESERTQYQVVYWDGRERKEVWVNKSEVFTNDSRCTVKTMKVGFYQ